MYGVLVLCLLIRIAREQNLENENTIERVKTVTQKRKRLNMIKLTLSMYRSL
jgi:hypothetical protein